MKQSILAFILFGLLFAFPLTLSNCSDDNDDDDDWGEDDDDDQSDPDSDEDDDDTSTDDDDDDDETSTDDDDEGHAPILVAAYFDPALFDMVETCTDDQQDPCTALIWEVCDFDSDLDGGTIFIYEAGTRDPAFGEHMEWYTWGSDPLDDCGNPYLTGINVFFKGSLEKWCPQAGETNRLRVDMKISDGAGNLSNKITDIEVSWNCP